MGVTLSKYYLIITMVTATPEFGTDLFIFHQENDTQQQCLDRLDANPDKYISTKLWCCSDHSYD